jgi:hypothetical protein
VASLARSDLLERSPVAVQRGFLAGQPLPALHNNVNIFRIQFHAVTDPLRQFGRRERAATADEPVIYPLAALGVVQDRRRISSTGFWVGRSNFSSSEPPMMNLGEGES